MTWTNLTFPFASLLTSTQMTQLDANFEALAAGDSGAPSIAEAAMGSASVNRAAHKTSTASVGTSVLGVSFANIALNPFSFFPMVHATGDAGEVNMAGHTVDGVGADNARFSIANGTAGTESFDVDHRFVLA